MKVISPVQPQTTLPEDAGSPLPREEQDPDFTYSTQTLDNTEEQDYPKSVIESKRPYMHVPEEFKPFFRGKKRSAFKRENLRQALARAVRNLHLKSQNPQYELKGGLLKRSPLTGSQEATAFDIIKEHSESIAEFRSTKTCVRHLHDQESFREWDAKSWTTEKWEEFKETPGIEDLLRIVIDAVFRDPDPEVLCKKWGKRCCQVGKHTEACRGKWSQMKRILLEECTAEEEETRSSTRRHLPDCEESEVSFDPFFVLNC